MIAEFPLDCGVGGAGGGGGEVGTVGAGGGGGGGIGDETLVTVFWSECRIGGGGGEGGGRCKAGVFSELDNGGSNLAAGCPRCEATSLEAPI